MGLHRSAAAFAAVADGVESASRSILKPGTVHMPPLVFGFDNSYGLFLADFAGIICLVLKYETSKRFSNCHTNIQRFTGILLAGPARTLHYGNMVWIFQDDILGQFVGNDIIQVRQRDVSVDAHQGTGLVQFDYFAVISTCFGA